MGAADAAAIAMGSIDRLPTGRVSQLKCTAVVLLARPPPELKKAARALSYVTVLYCTIRDAENGDAVLRDRWKTSDEMDSRPRKQKMHFCDTPLFRSRLPTRTMQERPVAVVYAIWLPDKKICFKFCKKRVNCSGVDAVRLQHM